MSEFRRHECGSGVTHKPYEYISNNGTIISDPVMFRRKGLRMPLRQYRIAVSTK